MTDAVVLDLAAGRVYHFKHGWIPLDHVGRERLRAHGVNPHGYNVVHNGKLAANWRTKREAIAHADRLNAGKKTAATVQPSKHAPGHHNVVKNGKLIATYQSEHGARRHADQLNAGTKAAASVHHATPTGTGARIDTPRSKARTSSRALATRLPADGRDKTAPARRSPAVPTGGVTVSPHGAVMLEGRSIGTVGERGSRWQASTFHGELIGWHPTREAAAGAVHGHHAAHPLPGSPGFAARYGASSALQTRADAAVRMKAPELRALAASGDKVAQAELDRRVAERAAHEAEMLRMQSAANNANAAARTQPTPSSADLTEAVRLWRERNPGKPVAGNERAVRRIADDLWLAKRQQGPDTGNTRAQESGEQARIRHDSQHSVQMSRLGLRTTATERAQQVAQDRHRTLEARRVAAEEQAGAAVRTGPGGQARLADPMAYARGHVGGNDPAEMAKLLTDAELSRIVARMPNTLEGRTAKAELARRKAK